jgi:hypothetical protein
MLPPLNGPDISLGKGHVMPIAKAQKNAPTLATTSPKKEATSNIFEGKVVTITGNKLVMRNKEGAAFTHTLAKDAKVTCDGKACKSEDLKPGNQIRVSTKKEDRNVATGVECLEKNKEFSTCCN